MTVINEPKRLSFDECVRINDSETSHPTDVVMACSPDPVLTHDGKTSQACRRCHCGRQSQHVELCNRPDAVARREKDARIQAAINARPLHVYDLSSPSRFQHAKMGDHWYWCRYHHRAEHVGWATVGCVRVGPFMSEREANRLNGDHQHGMVSFDVEPLGMEVEA